MPVTKTAQKALRQNTRRRSGNLVKKAAIQKIQKEIKKLLAKKEHQGARALLPKYYKALDKAAKGGVIKKNKAARLKGRTAKRIGTR